MKWYYNMKISVKLILGFIIVAALAGSIGVIGIFSLQSASKASQNIITNYGNSQGQLGYIAEAFQKSRAAVRDLIIETDPNNYKQYQDIIAAGDATITKNLAEFKATEQTASELANYAELEKSLYAYNIPRDQVIALAVANKNKEAYALLKKAAVPLGAIASKAIDDNIEQNLTTGGQLTTAAQNSSNRTILILIIIVIFSVIMSVVLGFIISSIIVKPIKKLLYGADKISEGNLSVDIDINTKDEVGDLAKSFRKMISAIKLLTTDANMLSAAAVAGKLDTRADASKHSGDFKKIVDGVNSTLDSVIGPLNVAAEYVDRISKGDIPPKITDTYQGDFNEIKNNLNTCIDAVNELVKDATMLSKAAIEGKLDTRADSTKHGGDFGKIVTGVNSTLDSVIEPLKVAAEYVDRISKGDIPSKITDIYCGDFNQIKNNLNNCIDNINALVADANMLSIAAVEGRLATRADATKHGGDYRKIVEGVNKTLDEVIRPIKEAGVVLKEMANGNLQLKVKGEYKGDNADIKNALNETIDSLSLYINEISEVLGEMSNSNLDLVINNDYKGDFAQIKDALNLIISSFNEVFSDINNSSDQVASGSRQVSDGSQALAQGATEQASSVEELTVSIAQVATQTKENAINANQANELALTARSNAEQGNEHMNGMLISMKEINESSSNISKIIKVIDDIAFQTNILALNAAVEAARAGQHGKGFAVVAEEVRNLAARSANAAKETTALIEGSIKKVEAGTQIANDTAKALIEIVGGVAKAANLVGDIANASNEQASAIAQINKGIEQVSKVVQTNSATAEESAAASEELSSQADILKQMIGKFKLKRSVNSNRYALGENDKSRMTIESKEARYQGLSEATPTTNSRKSKISLSDNEFGKY